MHTAAIEREKEEDEGDHAHDAGLAEDHDRQPPLLDRRRQAEAAHALHVLHHLETLAEKRVPAEVAHALVDQRKTAAGHRLDERPLVAGDVLGLAQPPGDGVVPHLGIRAVRRAHEQRHSHAGPEGGLEPRADAHHLDTPEVDDDRRRRSCEERDPRAGHVDERQRTQDQRQMKHGDAALDEEHVAGDPRKHTRQQNGQALALVGHSGKEPDPLHVGDDEVDLLHAHVGVVAGQHTGHVEVADRRHKQRKRAAEDEHNRDSEHKAAHVHHVVGVPVQVLEPNPQPHQENHEVYDLEVADHRRVSLRRGHGRHHQI